VLQLGYLFGGAAMVARVAGLTYAEYARRGFFELVAVAALTLPVLLIGHALLADDRPAETRFRLLGGALIVLVLLIMGSAMHRMVLYQQQFGLTEARFYASVFMAWLGMVFVWFSATVLRGGSDRFLSGALACAAAGLLALNALNPDSVIVSTNLSRAESSAGFDADYVRNLSEDAVPALMAFSGKLQPSYDAELRQILADWRPLFPGSDWRAWNYGRSRAWYLIKAYRTENRLPPS